MDTRSNKKSKLTLSVRTRHIAMLRRASKRKGKSITELVEELAEREEREVSDTDPGDEWIQRNLGLLAKAVRPTDWEGDDRMGHLLRKHAPRDARAH
jgi:hypothetical protein